MRYVRETDKGVAETVQDLQAAVERNHFGVLHVYDLKATLAAKGVEVPGECHILEICNPFRAAEILEADVGLSMVLPCRIAVYTEGGKTMVGMLNPESLLKTLSNDPDLISIAADVQEDIMTIIDEAV